MTGRASIGLAALLLAAVARAQPVDSEREQAIGRALAKEFESRHPLSTDAALIERVNRLAVRLAKAAGFELPAPIGVPKARKAVFAVLPGGLLYISAGVLDWLDTDEDLSLLVAHLIAHAAARHGYRQKQPSTTGPVILMGGPYGACHRLAPSTVPLRWQAVSARQEQEADNLAARYLALPAPDFEEVFEKLGRMRPLDKAPSLYRPSERAP